MAEDMKVRIGLYNNNLKVTNPKITKNYTTTVSDYTSNFKLVAGPLKSNGKQLKYTYVLEIYYRKSLKAHTKTLWAEGFNSQIDRDYAEKANEIASVFCKENGFMINNHLNSFPEFQAIISKINHP